jgi:hypothetical protein
MISLVLSTARRYCFFYKGKSKGNKVVETTLESSEGSAARRVLEAQTVSGQCSLVLSLHFRILALARFSLTSLSAASISAKARQVKAQSRS